MRASVLVAACVLVGGTAGAARADDEPLSRKELDRRLAETAYFTSLYGTELWEDQNYEGCFRLYQGALAAMQPLLDHRPELSESVLKKLQQAARLEPTKGAFVLRDALDAIQKETQTALAPAKEPQPKETLWARLGGEKVIRAAVTDFIDAAAADPKIDLTRGGKVKFDDETRAALEKHLIAKLSEATGGPFQYTGPKLGEAFAGLNVTDAEFTTAANLLVKALQAQDADDDAIFELVELMAGWRKEILGK